MNTNVEAQAVNAPVRTLKRPRVSRMDVSVAEDADIYHKYDQANANGLVEHIQCALQIMNADLRGLRMMALNVWCDTMSVGVFRDCAVNKMLLSEEHWMEPFDRISGIFNEIWCEVNQSSSHMKEKPLHVDMHVQRKEGVLQDMADMFRLINMQSENCMQLIADVAAHKSTLTPINQLTPIEACTCRQKMLVGAWRDLHAHVGATYEAFRKL